MFKLSQAPDLDNWYLSSIQAFNFLYKRDPGLAFTFPFPFAR